MYKVILIDYSPLTLDIIESILNIEVEFELEFYKFSNSKNALNNFTEIGLELVIIDIDIDMPHIDGFDLIDYIKSIIDTPIIVISGSTHSNNSTDTLLYCAKRIGAEFGLNKKLLKEELPSLVTRLLSATRNSEKKELVRIWDVYFGFDYVR